MVNLTRSRSCVKLTMVIYDMSIREHSKCEINFQLVDDMANTNQALLLAKIVLLIIVVDGDLQYVAPPECPNGFSNINNICYFVTQRSRFPPTCPFNNVLPFHSYIEVIPPNMNLLWVPVTRNDNNGLGFLQWTEASSLYKADFDFPYFISEDIKGKNCLVYHNNSYTAVSCKEEFPAVCAYSKLNQASNQMCNNNLTLCRQSDFTPQNKKCFCLGNALMEASHYAKAEFLMPYQNHIYSILTSDECTIGLERISNGSYIWRASQQAITYTYWSPHVIFDNKRLYGAATKTGWILTQAPLPCFLYEMEVNVPEPILELTYSADEDVFVLNITNSASLKELSSSRLVYCFSNAGSLNLIYRYENFESVSDNQYKFRPHKYGPGHYWCEGVTYADSKLIETEKYFLWNEALFPLEFVAILKLQYVQGTNPLSKEIIEFLERILFLKINSAQKHSTRYTSRVMKIVDVNDTSREVWINVHFSHRSSASVKAHPEFESLKILLNQILSELTEVGVELIDLLSVKECLQETNIVTWPTTKIDQDATPSEFCFDQSGIRIKRFCGGNFIDGARWYPFPNCTIPLFSPLTLRLLNFVGSDLDEEQLYQISLQYDEFSSFDIYLFAFIYEKWQQSNYDTFGRILDNILKVDSGVLQQCQYDMRGMDLILKITDKAALNGFSSNNFITKHFSANFSGILIRSNGTMDLWQAGTTIDEITRIENLESAILLSPQLLELGNEIVLKLFLSEVFFTSSVTLRLASRVVGIVLPEDLHKLATNIQIIYRASHNASSSCAFFSYNLTSPEGRGVWKTFPATNSLAGIVLCNFSISETAGLVLVVDNSSNLGPDLDQLLNSNSSVSEIIDNLLTISEMYYMFTASDVYLVGCILEKVSGDSEINLQALVRIVSNMHFIARSVLKESQKKGATDKILHSLDVILKNHNYRIPVNETADNLMIFISNVKETNLTGVVLLKHDDRFFTEALVGDVEIDTALEYDNLESAFVLTPELKQQLDYDSKVIITVFLNDGLFNGDSLPFKYVSKIYGVILPDVVNYSQPVSFVHSVARNDHLQRVCAHWDYNNTLSVLGSWKSDNLGLNLMELSHCQYWHTTHFALLLLDSDKYEFALLDWITLVNCSLSMFGLSCIVLTALLFKRWRLNTGNQLLLNFVLAIMLQIGVMYASGSVKNGHDELTCTIVGVLLHYSIVSQFCWMFVIAVLQFKRFVEVFGGPPKYILLKGCLCGWLLPCLPVACVYLLDHNNYINGKVGLCYPSNLGLYLGVWLPVAIVVVINFVIFIFIIYSVVHKKTECLDAGNNEAMFQWRLAVLLFFMLGLTWMLGFLSELDFGDIFVYLFCITATLQGFVMFLFFIVFNANTRYLYLHALKKCCHNKNY